MIMANIYSPGALPSTENIPTWLTDMLTFHSVIGAAKTFTFNESAFLTMS